MPEKQYPPHQQRVIAEQVELVDRTVKLNQFIQSERYSTLDDDEQTRLCAQLGAMWAYAFILGERIAHF